MTEWNEWSGCSEWSEWIEWSNLLQLLLNVLAFSSIFLKSCALASTGSTFFSKVVLSPRREARNAQKCETFVDSEPLCLGRRDGGGPLVMPYSSLLIRNALWAQTLPQKTAPAATCLVARPDPRRLRRQPAARIIRRHHA